MGIFSNLFGKKVNSEKLAVEMNANGIYVNDILVQLPCSIVLLEKILGKNRRVPTKAGVNFYWDRLGIMCYTRDGQNIHTLCVRVNNSEFAPSDDNKMQLFKGSLTVNGMYWETVMRRGKKTEFFRRIVLGNYSAVSEYGEFMDDTVLSGIEITCDSEISGNFQSIVDEYGIN